MKKNIREQTMKVMPCHICGMFKKKLVKNLFINNCIQSVVTVIFKKEVMAIKLVYSLHITFQMFSSLVFRISLRVQ